MINRLAKQVETNPSSKSVVADVVVHVMHNDMTCGAFTTLAQPSLRCGSRRHPGPRHDEHRRRAIRGSPRTDAGSTTSS